MVPKFPEIIVPPPICKVANPLVFVVDAWVSAYTTVPVAVVCKMLIFTPIFALETKTLLAFLITA